jgi:hypothetical protein
VSSARRALFDTPGEQVDVDDRLVGPAEHQAGALVLNARRDGPIGRNASPAAVAVRTGSLPSELAARQRITPL